MNRLSGRQAEMIEQQRKRHDRADHQQQGHDPAGRECSESRFNRMKLRFSRSS